MILNTHETEAWWLERMLNQANMATSYKLFWFKGIFELIVENNHQVISFEDIGNKMIYHAWYPVVTYKLSFGIQDRLSTVVEYLKEQYPELLSYSNNQLYAFLSSSDVLSQDSIYRRLKTNLFQMVPYRLLSPFFDYETRGIKDQKKNRMIVDLASDSNSSMYYFVDQNHIKVSLYWMDYLKRNQAVIKSWIQYKMISYFQSKNPNVPNILLKLEPPVKRNMTKATNFWKKALVDHPIEDIYTGKLLKDSNFELLGNLSMDHFIPWTFVSHDEFWNLCPTFKNVNSQKSDHLPKLEDYLSKYNSLHHFAINELKRKSEHKLLETYHFLNNRDLMHFLVNGGDVPREVVYDALSQTIIPLHQIALNQGFTLW